MRVTAVITLLLLACVIQLAQAQVQPHFYILGSMTCPHCRHLKESLAEAYGAEAVTFLEVSEPENNAKYRELYALLYPEAPSMWIPLTIVVVGGEPALCAVGDIGLDNWRHLTGEAVKRGKFLKVELEGGVVELGRGAGEKVGDVLGLRVTATESLGAATRDAPATPATISGATTNTPPSALVTATAALSLIIAATVVLVMRLKWRRGPRRGRGQ